MPRDKKVLVKNLDTGEEFEDIYDKLFISAGAYSMKPQIPGTELDGVFTLKTINDGVAVKNWVSKPETRDIVIIGGGYIGFEMAETLAEAGKKVRIIHRSGNLLKTFDPEIAALARQELERLGVEIGTNENISAIKGSTKVEKVITDRGAYKADMVLLAIGVKPATAFLENSGIALLKNGAIVIDRQLRTNLPDIYAAGDCAEIYHLVKKTNDYIPLATTANKCGRIAGENLGGRQIEFPGTLGSAAVKVGELELARTGLSEAEAAKLGFDYKTTMILTDNKPFYYPGSDEIRLKLIYEKGTKRMLGAQGIEKSGVVLRINVIACAISGKLTAEQLGFQDFCYAPPFSTVWDAVNIVSNTAK
jgi:NADPH-dependent 2,4-dienoyl-CoA reductase/sulfur reductase-like enzyme